MTAAMTIFRPASAISMAALGAIVCLGCDGAFVGPPGAGGGLGASSGDEPIVGASPLNFAPEFEELTGFATDIFHLSAGLHTDITNITADGDGVDALKFAHYDDFIAMDPTETLPREAEINVQFPMTISFISQWFRRNADGSRIQTLDAFGNLEYSSTSLDISFVTLPLLRTGNNVADALASPALMPGGPLEGWDYPAANPPDQFPRPFETFFQAQFSRVSIVLLGFQNGGGVVAGTELAHGLVDNDKNEFVENCGTTVTVNPQTGTFPPNNEPTGVFGEVFAGTIINEAVWQPDEAPAADPQTITDPFFERALVEYSRHLGAVFTSVIAECIGLTPTTDGTLTDTARVQWFNEYQYAFSLDTIDILASKVIGDLDPNDPDKNVGLLPGLNR
ncbi:MAG: hypothetical protein HUU29_14590 [Planctomycetaceae bacterium]|nr:hypothetical protein [Planctomycetaceae bacterium]